MNKIVSAILLVGMVLSACGPAATEPPAPTEVVATEQPVATEVVVPATAETGPTELPLTVPLDLKPEDVGSGPRLIFLVSTWPATFDPNVTSGFVGHIAAEMWDNLVTYEVNWDTGIANQEEVKPQLAESWEISADNKVITFHLREDVTFWDGTPLTAEDVKFSIERGLVGKLGWGGNQIQSGGILSIDQIEVVDPYTLRVTYPDGIGRFSLRNLHHLPLSIMSKKACVENSTPEDPYCTEWIKKNVMGSGPYILSEYKEDEYLILKANTNYWGEPKPYYSEVMLRMVPDPQASMLLLLSDEAQIAYLTPKEYKALSDAPDVRVFSVPVQQDVAVMRWNPDYPPFDDIKIREAVIKAIPYDRIAPEACQGFCTPVHNLIGSYTTGYWEEPLFTTDIEAAKKLVAESKYAEGVPSFEVVLPASSMQGGAVSASGAAAVLIQDALRGIGIDMQIRLVTQNAFQELARVKRDLKVSVWAMGPVWNDFMYFMYWMWRTDSTTNHIRYSNAMLDENVVAALLVPFDQSEEYLSLQKEVIDLLINERLAAPLFQGNFTIAHSTQVCNVTFWPWQVTRLSYLRPCQ